MKVIIAGSSSIESRERVEEAIRRSGFLVTEVVCRDEAGVADTARKWASDNNIDRTLFCGEMAEEEMVIYADALIAIWDGKDNNPEKLFAGMEKLRKPVYWVTII